VHIIYGHYLRRTNGGRTPDELTREKSGYALAQSVALRGVT